MKVIQTDLSGVLVLEPKVFKDDRGFFLESYRSELYATHGIKASFVQDNHSRSAQGTLRGLHAQLRRPQSKLVRVVSGEIFDVVVDIRKGSPTFKRWIGVTLSADNFKQIWVPAGFAHGFYTLSSVADVEYKVTDYYDPGGELHLRWDDPEIGVQWPAGERILSGKDVNGKSLKELLPELPVYSPGA